MLKGIAASAGYAVGKIYKLNRPELVIEKRTADAETELAKLAQAITLTHDDITLIKERATGKLSDEDLAIFDAHLMVLSDPEYTGQIENYPSYPNISGGDLAYNIYSQLQQNNIEFILRLAAEKKI